MKKLLVSLLSVTLLSLAGCAAWLKLPPTTRARVADHFGYDLVLKALKGHEENRVKLKQVSETLHLLSLQPQLDAISVVELIESLPFAQSDDSRIALDAGILIIAIVGNPTVKAETSDAIKEIAENISLGMNRLLNQNP